MKKVFISCIPILIISYIYFNQKKTQPKERNPNNILVEITDQSSDYLFQNYHSDLFCSSPPKKEECPTYVDLLSSKDSDGYKSIFNAKSNNGRPCFIHEYFDDSLTEKIYSVGRNYQIFKSNQNNLFELVIPIFFRIRAQDHVSLEEQSFFKEKINSCMQKAGSILTDGNITFQIKPLIMFTTSLTKGEFRRYFDVKSILNENPKDYPWNEINLYKSNIERIDFQNYALDMNCGDIAHEIFHLLGLHDEYINKYGTYSIHPDLINLSRSIYSSDKANKFDCRISSDDPNLMKDQRDYISVNDDLIGHIGLRSDQTNDIVYPSCLSKEPVLTYAFKSINAYRNKFEDLKKTCLQ